MTPRARAKWGEYLNRDGRCSLCIDASNLEENQWHKRVLVKGRAERIDGPRTWYPEVRDDTLAQRGFLLTRRYFVGNAEADANLWRHIESDGDMGFWSFRIQPIEITSWWGEYARRYRNVYPSTP